MDVYINLEKAIKAVENLQDCHNGFSDTYDKACIIGLLEELPAKDEGKIVAEYCRKRNYVLVAAEYFKRICQ